jgi:hypothetical protein
LRLANKDILIGIAFACLVLASAELILVLGAIGSGGNRYITGTLYFGTLLAIFLLGLRRLPGLTIGDAIFATLLIGIIGSFAINPWRADTRESLLLLMSLFAYFAARSISVEQLPFIRNAFKWMAGGTVLLGSILTGKALMEEWYSEHGHPHVLGFDDAATNFARAMGIFALAIVSDDLTKRRAQILCAALAVPSALFGASLVRFALGAIIGSLMLNIILSKNGRQRKYMAALAITVLVSSGLGYVARHQSMAIYVEKKPQISETKTQPAISVAAPQISREEKPPSCASTINEDDTVSVRKALLKDAMYLLPRAGLFGLGMESFPEYSCIAGYEIHNSLLQTFVELGWIAGGALIALIGYAGLFTLELARRNSDARFILCMLAYETALSLVYGRASREMALFAIIGCTVGTIETAKSIYR